MSIKQYKLKDLPDKVRNPHTSIRFKGDKTTYSSMFVTSSNKSVRVKNEKTGETKTFPIKDIIRIGNDDIEVINERLELLKQIIKEEIEDFKSSEPLTFEGNPLEFILQKYDTLDATMIDLMTPSFRDYITGIFIIAPKPTTFRVLLHNNQEFHLIYGPQAYIARISGKKYNLINLSEEEFAIKSIAQLLELGMPPGSEGPAEENKNEADLQSNSQEETPAETPPEEETPPAGLKESIKKFRIKL
jgi:hypothetical protein